MPSPVSFLKKPALGRAGLVSRLGGPDGFFFSPVSSVMDTLLDSSNYASYTYFAAHHFQYGPEVVPMTGPYGYVMYGSGLQRPALLDASLPAAGLCRRALRARPLVFPRSRESAWRWLWLGLIMLLSPVIEDLPLEWMIQLAGLFLLQRSPAAPGRSGPCSSPASSPSCRSSRVRTSS